MAKERKDNSFIKKPVYPGGNGAYRKFIKDNLRYPKEAKEKKIEGVVFLKYTIDHKGSVTEVQVVKGIGHGCDKEAKRIIKLLKFEIPKGPRKLRVTFHKKTQITFRLPKVKTKPKPKTPAPTTKQKVRLVYQYKPAETKPNTKKKSYGYTIKGNIKDLL